MFSIKNLIIYHFLLLLLASCKNELSFKLNRDPRKTAAPSSPMSSTNFTYTQETRPTLSWTPVTPVTSATISLASIDSSGFESPITLTTPSWTASADLSEGWHTLYIKQSTNGMTSTVLSIEFHVLGQKSAAYTTVTNSSGSVAADGTSYATLKVQLRDTDNLPIPGMTPELTLSANAKASLLQSCTASSSEGESTCSSSVSSSIISTRSLGLAAPVKKSDAVQVSFSKPASYGYV